jgi:hypothetical protein
MNLLRKSRWALLALLLCLVPASSFAGVFVSVGFAPPVLPVYVQPACPQPGWMWTPGYWGYGDEGYYWVPGAWVPAPYEGALWTPPYWGWSGGLYVFHAGYWGPHVGYYGGVNYGFGYMGVGFAGGMWHGHDFVYNTAIVNVNRTVIHNTYIDRTVVERNTITNDRHVAYSGGPGGIRHEPMPEERMAMNERHVATTNFQQQHMDAARFDHASYVKNNGGHPQNLAVERPMGMDRHAADMHQAPVNRPQYDARPAPAPQHQAEMHQQPEHNYQQQRPNYQQPQPQHNNQQQRPEAHPAPQQHDSHPQHEQQNHPQHEDKHEKGH